jgi:redox-sensitive bicupin YhaK (pirin superfamily)
MQLWLAQPDSTRRGSASFQHLDELPQFEIEHVVGQLIVGEFANLTSNARIDSPDVAVELRIRPGRTTLPLFRAYEYALIVASGAVRVLDQVVTPGSLAYLSSGRDEITFDSTEESVALLIGGEPLQDKLMMWWNFVARTQEELSEAYSDWASQNERFGSVNSKLPRVPITPPVWFK